MTRKNFRYTIVLFLVTFFSSNLLGNNNNLSSLDKMIICTPSALMDCGYVYQGQKIKRVFEIRNISDEYISIKTIKNSCGCTSVLSAYEGIKPSETISIEAVVDTSGKPEGVFNVSINLVLGQDKGVIKLELTGQIIIPNPEKIDFGDVYKDKKIVGKLFYLKTLPNENLNISEITYDKTFFDVKVVAPNFWNRLKYHKVMIKCHKNIPSGIFEKKIVIKTDRNYEPDISVILTGRMMGLIEAEPPTVSLGILRADMTIIQELKVYSPYEKSFVIQKITNPFPENLLIEYEPTKISMEHIVKIHLKKAFRQGKISGNLRIITTISDELNVGIFGIQK